MCGFDVWVARFGFDGFRRLGCWISRVTVEMVVVVGRIGVGPICDLWLWVCFVVCCGCFVVVVGLLVMLYWCLGGGCAAFLFIWSRLRKKIGDLGLFFFFPPYCGLVANGGGGCGCGCG